MSERRFDPRPCSWLPIRPNVAIAPAPKRSISSVVCEWIEEMRSKESLELTIGKQDDLRYRWQLSRPSGRVIEDGVEAYIASCLAAAAARWMPGAG